MVLPDKEVGVFGVLSMLGTDKCATITDPTPAAINARKGASSKESNAALDLIITGKSKCESTATSPWPGKCLAVAITLLSCSPFI